MDDRGNEESRETREIKHDEDHEILFPSEMEDGKEELKTTRKAGDAEHSPMLIDSHQSAGEAVLPEASVGRENDVMDTTELCYESELLPALPSAGSLESQEPPLHYPESYMSHLDDRGVLLSTMPPPTSPSNYFQESNLNVASSTAVTRGSWEQLHSSHTESEFGNGPSSSNNASPVRCNSTEERAFVDSLCEEPSKSDCLVTGKNPDPSGASFDTTVTKRTTFEAIHSSAVSDPENEFESALTTEDMAHGDKEREPSSLNRKEEKSPISGLSLRNVLSDPITGNLLDDAMVAMCGHSFGGGSLQKLYQMHSCINCGASVSPNTLVPNFALRAAVLAYRHEHQVWQADCVNGTKRRREHCQEPEVFRHNENTRVCSPEIVTPNDSKQESGSPGDDTLADNLRLKGVQFPFSVNDRVLIKGNKRTPERFFGMEALITSQCLNGWYLVKTLKTCESVRLQYRSLQKLGETELPSYSEAERSTEEGAADGRGSPLPSVDPKEFSFLTESASDDDLRRAGAAVQRQDDIIASHSNQTNCIATPLGDSSANEIREESGVAGAKTEDALINNVIRPNFPKEKGVDTDQLKDNTSVDEEHGIFKDICEVDTTDMISGKSGDRDPPSIPESPGVGATDEGTGKVHFQMRRKLTASHAGGSGDFVDFGLNSEPYRKVYDSGSQIRDTKGDLLTLFKQTNNVREASDRKSSKSEDVGTSKLGGRHRTDTSLRGEGEILNILRRDMLKLEMQTPRKLLLHTWKARRSEWRKLVQLSQKVSELGAQVRDFRNSVLLTAAGGMSDEEWDRRTALIIESGDIELLVSVWGRLYDDINKWIRSRPNVLLQDRLERCIPLGRAPGSAKHGEHKKDSNGHERALSSVHATTTATFAAVEAVGLGQQDPGDCIKALLASTRKFIQQQSCTELSTVREVLEREKRHITAKLAALESRFANLEGYSGPKASPLSKPPHLNGISCYSKATQLAVAADSQDLTEDDKFAHPQDSDTEEGNSDATLPARDDDGEATDMSDSD